MRRSRFDYTRFGIEPPFPWLGIGLGLLIGAAIVPVAGWVAFELIDCSLERFTP